MTERKIHLHTVAFDSDSLTVTFMVDPGGLRAGGSVFLTQQMTLNREAGDYKARVDRLEKKLEALVLEALEDWESSEPVPMTDAVPTEHDDDDDLGMGYDPDDTESDNP
jgi:hypothetical protein